MANVIEILDVDPEELGVEEDGAHVDLDSQRKGIVQKCLDGSYGYLVSHRPAGKQLTFCVLFRKMRCHKNFN